MLKVENLFKTFSTEKTRFTAVDHISFSVPEKKFFTLLGPSGCGKTTTLRCIAGLEHPDGGTISISGKLVSGNDRFLPPNNRNIGMVFQSYAIWPHMNVFANVAFPLRVDKARRSKQEIQTAVMNALKVVELDGFEKRPATKLSGGQQQRLALARALVNQPKLLLLDEPLSNLDAKLRDQMRIELGKLQQRIGITTVYVTHDQVEALALSDLIAVMRNGRIEQIGSPREIYEKPANQFIAGFIGTTNWLKGKVIAIDAKKIATVETVAGRIASHMVNTCKPGDTVLLSIRPEAIRVEMRKSTDQSLCEARVETAMYLGDHIDSQIRIGDNTLKVKVHPKVSIQPGDRVYIQIIADYCVALSS